jgi:hypothetical protein
MEPLASVIPSKKARVETDLRLCLICQKEGDLVANPSPASYEKVVEYIHQRAKYGEEPYPSVSSRIHGLTSENLEASEASWHRDCYATTCHKIKLDRAKQHFEKSMQTGKNPKLGQVPGRPTTPTPSSSVTVEPSTAPFKWSSSHPFHSAMCFFCQKHDASLGKLHEVTSFNSGKKLRAAVAASDSDIFKVRLSTAIDPKDAHAIDVKYHLPCWVTNVDRVIYEGANVINSGCNNTKSRRKPKVCAG